MSYKQKCFPRVGDRGVIIQWCDTLYGFKIGDPVELVGRKDGGFHRERYYSVRNLDPDPDKHARGGDWGAGGDDHIRWNNINIHDIVELERKVKL